MATASKPILAPLNDLLFKQLVEDVDPTSGVATPVVDTSGGIFSVFLATTPQASAPDDSNMVGTATHIGVLTPGDGESPLGTWLYEVDASVLTQESCDNLFPAGKPGNGFAYLIVMRANGFKRYLQFKYQSAEAATLVVT